MSRELRKAHTEVLVHTGQHYDYFLSAWREIVIEDGFRLNLKEMDAVCMHSLASLMPYYVALSKGASPTQLGLAGEGGRAYVQCLDPAKHTGGGTVTFGVEVCELRS